MADHQDLTDAQLVEANEDETGVYDPLHYDVFDLRNAKERDILPAKVIAAVREYDVIYDCSKQVHRKRQVLLQAWGSIAKNLQISSKFSIHFQCIVRI